MNTPSDLQKNSFWALSAEETAAVLETDLQKGLTEEEAANRLKLFGPNIIEKPRRAAGFFIFLNQFRSPLILILLFAGAVTLAIGRVRDSFFILAAVLVNAALGFYQENKAEKALAELKTYLKQRARVVRGGAEREIDAERLVPGDLIRLAQGDRVPADARLVFTNDLYVDEAVLTGESLPVPKSAGPVRMDAPLGDQQSMAFTGTLITQGVGDAIVCRTDFFTEFGKIASAVAVAREEATPLQKAIKRFSVYAGAALGGLTLAVFGAGIAAGYSVLEMFLTSVAVAVSAVPEGLPVALTAVLAIGVQRMARRKGVVRKLIAAEALGGATLILTDKTGTLTMAKMELSRVLPSTEESERRVLELAALNANVLLENPADPPEKWRMSGRVLETALARAAATRGITAAEVKKKIAVLNYLPFNAVNKFSVSLTREHGRHFLVFVGAPEILLAHSALSAAEKEKELANIGSLAEGGELLLGVAAKEIENGENFVFARDLKLSHLSFLGLIAFRDPVRPGLADIVRRLEMGGVKTVIITGDHRGTAAAVAKEIGLPLGENGIMDAAELRALSDDGLKKLLPAARVIARVSPLDKARIVKAYQELGEVVAMTGDGVNDAPSIKQADAGIAMGSGTEVARDVADLVLLDDNFETIAAAVEEGRRIVKNVKKVIVYLLSSVADELFLIGGALTAGLVLPLNALQILWVNFFSDSFPAVAFAFEKDIDGLDSRPRGAKDGLFDPLMKFLIWFIGIATSALLFALYWILLRAGFQPELVRTFIFAGFGSYSLFLAFSVRSLEKSIFAYHLFSNRYLVLGTGIGLVLMAASIYVPFLQPLFGTIALPPLWLAGVLAVGALNIAAVELGKWFFRRRVE